MDMRADMLADTRMGVRWSALPRTRWRGPAGRSPFGTGTFHTRAVEMRSAMPIYSRFRAADLEPTMVQP